MRKQDCAATSAVDNCCMYGLDPAASRVLHIVTRGLQPCWYNVKTKDSCGTQCPACPPCTRAAWQALTGLGSTQGCNNAGGCCNAATSGDFAARPPPTTGPGKAPRRDDSLLPTNGAAPDTVRTQGLLEAGTHAGLPASTAGPPQKAAGCISEWSRHQGRQALPAAAGRHSSLQLSLVLAAAAAAAAACARAVAVTVILPGLQAQHRGG